MIVCDYDERVKALREHAEWVGPNNYELPISMYDDLLKAADAIEELQKAICPHYIRNVRDKGDDSLCNKFICEVSEQPSQQWISVEERLPCDEKPVLACYGFDGSKDANRRWCGVLTYFAFEPNPHWQHERTGLHVTHWMPLPEPPRKEFADGT